MVLVFPCYGYTWAVVRWVFKGPLVLLLFYIVSDTIYKSFHLMILYENELICIFMNYINENLKNEGKTIELKYGVCLQNTPISAAIYLRTINLVSN